MKKIFVLSAILLGVIAGVRAQDAGKNAFSVSGYAEVYYQHDFNNPQSNTRPDFVYSLNRNNEVALNLGLIKVNYGKEQVRANLGFGIGSYMNANYSAEQGVLKNVYEANIGVKLSKKHQLWLDAGVLPSHIGFESAVGADCFTLTRSMMAENSPYFETGARLSYKTENGQWDMTLFLLNGWQRIQRVDGNTTPAFGHQLTYTPNEKITFNSSSFIGNDFADEKRKMRYFHNLYGLFKLSNRISLIAGFDIGAQQTAKGSNKYAIWYTPVLIAKYALIEKFSIAVRGEYYCDKNKVLVASNTANGFQTFGASLNLDYQILPNLIWRTELKGLKSKDALFVNQQNEKKKQSVDAITSLAIRF